MIWLLGPALAATVTTYVVALATRPPATCKLKVFLPEGRFAPGSEVSVRVEIETVTGPLVVSHLLLRLLQSPGSSELLARYGSVIEPEERVLQSLELSSPGRLEAGATYDFSETLQLPGHLESHMLPTVEARLWLEGNPTPVKARRLLKLS